MKQTILGLIALVAITFASCDNGTKIEQVVYKGSNREAIIENLMTRRSIRKYTDKQVDKAQLDTIMQAAIFAPSANNKQPWEIRVVQNQDLISEFAKRGGTDGNPNYGMTYNAPTIIVLASDTTNPFGQLDNGSAMENILLSAHALGLGTCPLGGLSRLLNNPDNVDLIKALNIPDGYEISIALSLGYPDETAAVKARYTEKVKYIK